MIGGLSSIGCRNSEDSSRSYFSVRWVDEEPCLSTFFLGIFWGSGLIGGGGCWDLAGSGRDPSKTYWHVTIWQIKMNYTKIKHNIWIMWYLYLWMKEILPEKIVWIKYTYCYN